MIQWADVVPVLLGLLGAVWVVLTGVLSWVGGMIWRRLEEIAKLLRTIEKDLRGDLSALDRRVSRIEGHCENCKGNTS